MAARKKQGKTASNRKASRAPRRRARRPEGPIVVAAAAALPWSASAERVARLDDVGLNRLMQELLTAEAYRCGANRSQHLVAAAMRLVAAST